MFELLCVTIEYINWYLIYSKHCVCRGTICRYCHLRQNRTIRAEYLLYLSVVLAKKLLEADWSCKVAEEFAISRIAVDPSCILLFPRRFHLHFNARALSPAWPRDIIFLFRTSCLYTTIKSTPWHNVISCLLTSIARAKNIVIPRERTAFMYI